MGASSGIVDLAAVCAAVQAAPMSASLDGLTDETRSLEVLKACIEARQADLALAIDQQVRTRAAERGEPAARQGRGAAELVARARRVTPAQGRFLLATARRARALPEIRDRWAVGELDERRVTAIVRETVGLDADDVVRLDDRLAEQRDLGELAVRKIAHAARAIATELDAATVEARRAHAVEDRHVRVRPTDRGDGMGWLIALLPIEQAYACKQALDTAADTAVAAGAATSRGQVRADTLVARITGSDALGLDTPAQGVRLNLIMTDAALLGDGDEPAWLSGMGPIPAGLAAGLVTRSMAAGMTTTLRRLYSEPETGRLVAMESRARRFPPALAEFITLRDQLCRTPSCGAPIAHIDHVQDWARGGSTSVMNGDGTCRQCNWAKQNPDLVPDTGSPPALHPPRRPPPRLVVMEVHHHHGEPLRVEIDLDYPRAA